VTIHAIDRAFDNFKKIGKANLTLGVVGYRLQQLKDHFTRFERLHGQIMAAASNEFIMTDRYFTEDQFDKCVVTFLTASDYMAEWMSRLESPPPSQVSSPNQGSVTTLFTERLAQRLRLPCTCVSVSITGIGETAATARSAAKVHVSARDGTGPSPSISALVLKSLTTYIPQPVPDITKLSYIHKLPLADSDRTSAAPIDVIISAELYGAILLPEIRNRAPYEPVAQNSIFGWFLSEPMPMPSQSRPACIQTHHCTVLSEISDQLKRFWEVEELPQQTHLLPEEIRCEEHFVSTHSRAPNKQYIVRLPFKSGPPIDIGDFKQSAIALYSRLESRLKANPDLAKEYHDFLAEYERLDHMTKAPLENPPDDQIVYIPHQAVVREHSATTRLRVVFNASQPTSNGLSLNDHLMIGRKLQSELSFIILRWRQFRFVFTADIAKMYRQILVHNCDVDYQRILWRPAPNYPLIAYRLLTVTYGNANAPNAALRVVEQVAEDKGADFLLAVPDDFDHQPQRQT
ncbi:uncharacterized protein LOC112457950, partial [Temnothorax curvispinosus]|uniref:Uncharacterized protein LOC112457950 n=1 Tax=Temnothorax curvispinosus TaxID=300111 RepID=A0A6J1Q5V5_9HYME